MNYLSHESLVINYFEYNKIDLMFMDKTYSIGIKYPYKWYEFIHSIIHNQRITYFKDTTMIVTLLDLDMNQIKILFEILKEYLKVKLLKKVLYYREFIIVHFHNIKTTNILRNKCLWISMFAYYMIKDKLYNIDIHLQGIIRDNEHKDIVDLIIKHNNILYLISSNKILDNIYPNVRYVYLIDRLVNYKTLPNYYKNIKFSLNQNEFIKEFINLLLLEE